MQQRGELQSLREQLQRLQQVLQQCQADLEDSRVDAHRCELGGDVTGRAECSCCWKHNSHAVVT